METEFDFRFKYWLPLIFILTGVGCSKLGQDESSPEANKSVKHSNSRTVSIDYDGMVDTINTLTSAYFADEDFDDLDFTYFWDQAEAIDPVTVVDTTILKTRLRNAILSVQYTGLEGTLASFGSITFRGSDIILELKDDLIYAIDHSASYSTIQTLLQGVAEDAVENGSLNSVEQGTIFIACVILETGLNPVLEWSQFNGNPHSSSRDGCNLVDILIDIAISSALNIIVIDPGGDGKPGLQVTDLIYLAANLIPSITITSVVVAILMNCWEVISDFFTDVWHGILDWADKIFGEAEDCTAPNGIWGVPLDCAGDLVQFNATQPGEDIVAFNWTAIGALPSTITTPTRFAIFAPTSNSVIIFVEGICSNGVPGAEIDESFSITELIDDEPVSDFEFNEYHFPPFTNHEYEFLTDYLPNDDETVSWIGGTNVTIGVHDVDWVKATFTASGTRTITCRVINVCNSHFRQKTLEVTVY